MLVMVFVLSSKQLALLHFSNTHWKFAVPFCSRACSWTIIQVCIQSSEEMFAPPLTHVKMLCGSSS